MGNPFESPYESLRQSIIDESKKKAAKRQKRWQDDDADGKWYEKSDVDGKISKREKEEKKKQYAKEDIADIIAQLEKKRISKGGDPKDSPLPSMRKYHADKKKKVKEAYEVNNADRKGNTKAWQGYQPAPALYKGFPSTLLF